MTIHFSGILYTHLLIHTNHLLHRFNSALQIDHNQNSVSTRPFFISQNQKLFFAKKCSTTASNGPVTAPE